MSMELCGKNASSVADGSSVYKGDKFRFTFLTSRLVRLEYDEDGRFEDRATQTVINRRFEPVVYRCEKRGSILKLITEDIQLTYNGGPFTENSLSICYTGKNAGIDAASNSSEWRFGRKNLYNLKGTRRTLDLMNGECDLEDGIMSRTGEVCVLEDSKSLVINPDGSIEPRKKGCIDQYIFCYGLTGEQSYDYKGSLKDYYKLTGKTPMIPRYALGNWWSRYHAYTQEEYKKLMERFKQENIAFSVAVLDMDWHYVKIDPKYGNGWTGYSWNEELFPKHQELLDWLHEEGYAVSLNLHPNDGVGAHEKMYGEMASAMGIDPDVRERVEFDITDSRFRENYFSVLHHPLEEEGVSFWWIDWQQGNTTSVEGLDPLWMLNHYHYLDHGRDGKRPMILSRYSGPGSHRYPIGFSGDTFVTWEALDLQPYFTATASNIGYGWWSHDIGGHMYGYRDEELITRWVQWGVFSPINRLHSCSSRFQGKEPWKYNEISEKTMKKFLKLRHELIPYIYTMNYRAAVEDEPLIQPLYYNWAVQEAYLFKNEYSFGSEMIVTPITQPQDKETMCGSVIMYFPEGEWYDFFSGVRYTGGRTLTIYRDIKNMPVFVKAGGIIPMAQLEHVNDIENPQKMTIRVYAGTDNVFELYEDDGISNEYLNVKYAITKMKLDWSESPVFTIEAPRGDASVIPQNRTYQMVFIGIEYTENIIVTEDGVIRNVKVSKGEVGEICVVAEEVRGRLEVYFDAPVSIRKNNISNIENTIFFIIQSPIQITKRWFAHI